MSLPDRNNPYNFNPFLRWRETFDYYCDDPFLQKVVKHHVGDEWEHLDRVAREFSAKASFRWRTMAESIARPERHPSLMHFDAHNHRIDRIVRPFELQIMEKEVFAEGLFSDGTSRWERLVKMYLLYQNGDACLACPVTCTEGLVALLERFAETPETLRILEHCKEGIDGDFGIGAQYLTEIQGGSDVPANRVEAVQEGQGWRLYGKKFFCSAAHADYAVVTAKPTASDAVGLFVVPSWLPGFKEQEVRNGYAIDRLKWKLGTSELPTAEITFDGAEAYPLGPLERGLSIVVGIVLTYSRLTVGLSSAACMTRAAREARRYGEFREAFGLKIDRFPMLANQIQSMERAAKRTTAGVFKVYGDFLAVGGTFRGGQAPDESEEERKKRFNVRELIMLQKIAATWDAMDVIRSAMSVFGGHGVMEDFSSLPRLYRDAAINELWEGPRNVLLAQVHRDMQRAADWYPAIEFVRSVLLGSKDALIDELGWEMSELVSHPSLMAEDEKTVEVCQRWDVFCHRLFHAYQELALGEVEQT